MSGRELLVFAAMGFGGAVGIICTVLATGQTFGQRCERYFPDATPVEIAVCVEHLSAGKPVSSLPELSQRKPVSETHTNETEHG